MGRLHPSVWLADDTPLTKELPGQHGNQQVDQIKPKGKNNILQKRPRGEHSFTCRLKKKKYVSKIIGDNHVKMAKGVFSCLGSHIIQTEHQKTKSWRWDFMTFPFSKCVPFHFSWQRQHFVLEGCPLRENQSECARKCADKWFDTCCYVNDNKGGDSGLLYPLPSHARH